MDLDRAVTGFVEDVEIEAQTFVYGQLRAMKMEGLYGVGGSSEYPPVCSSCATGAIRTAARYTAW